jgi:hypothetical protein
MTPMRVVRIEICVFVFGVITEDTPSAFEHVADTTRHQRYGDCAQFGWWPCARGTLARPLCENWK